MTADPFHRNIAVSLALHLGAVLLIFFRAVMVPNEAIDIRNAIRVDMVDLPRKMETLPEPATEPTTVEKPKELPKKVEPTPKAVHTPTPVSKNTKVNVEKTQSNALSKIKAMNAMEKIKKELEEEREKNARKAKRAAEPVRGNKVSAGNSLTGLERIEYDRYFDELRGKILSQFNVPQWLADADLKAQVLVLIDERGYVVKRVLKTSSGNDVFDSKVLEAIENSSPLPPPPSRLRGLLSTAGIVFNFPQ